MKKAFFILLIIIVALGILIGLDVLIFGRRQATDPVPGPVVLSPSDDSPGETAAPQMPQIPQVPPSALQPGGNDETGQEEPEEPEVPDETGEAGDGQGERIGSQSPRYLHPRPDRVRVGSFELPVNGATGWAAVQLTLRSEPRSNAQAVLTHEPGSGFTILEERGGWWRIEVADGTSGWVEHRRCFINLPDVLPSVIYRITNASYSEMRSSGVDIPGITGYTLYDAWNFNPRLDRYEFLSPALYSTARTIAAAQEAALENGDTLIIYEVFRPYETQMSITSNLRELMAENDAVRSAINTPPWSIGWFIATTMSNHQRGAAIDVSLGRVVDEEMRQSGGHSYRHIAGFTEYPMPTVIHELSPRAAVFSTPVSASSRDAWRFVPHASTMTEGAIRMQGYFDEAGLTPISSEWWHFTDYDGVSIASGSGISGNFFIESDVSFSRAP